MVELSICVGSACHLKGSYEVIEIFKKCVRDRNLFNEVEIKGAFCLGRCTEAVSVMFNDKIYSVNPETAESFFNDIIIKSMRNLT
ncbi:(2Fe-2S) ferredoxin domain-containing protein [Sedimentibacter sp. MB31-C6]|uniref:(2Fe-2S) ferredoxin domain-containing protein n=1 Tax=Sedimentibacter sp. MB31-C6 TaxID=3109366 RepID=UPI002DDD24D7|nr:(2Fe-2S) ferredoxin domain-containing protein [Sedimentibacter sp. MB36-C1]WSI05277.1 (2Fe-2S) ferredoxin domain-containing protein [Sedimentibacter sp. MB36-C1]